MVGCVERPCRWAWSFDACTQLHLLPTAPAWLQGNDLSADIAVLDATCSNSTSSSNATAGAGALCWPCDPQAAQQRRCLPGRYTWSFTVLDDGGASATAQLRLLIVQRFRVQVTVSLFPPEGAAGGAAEATAAAAAAVAGNATLGGQLAAAMNASLAPALQPHDLDVTAAATADAAVGQAPTAAAASVQLLGVPVQLLRWRMAQAPPPPALLLTFSLDAASPSPLLYAGASVPALPAAAASLQLQSIDAVFADSLQQAAAATCSALAAALAQNPSTAAALQGPGGSFSCSPPVLAGSASAETAAVDFDALTWLPGKLRVGACSF